VVKDNIRKAISQINQQYNTTDFMRIKAHFLGTYVIE
jgi:hypothetical protein